MNFTKLFIALGIIWAIWFLYAVITEDWLIAAGTFVGTVMWFALANNEHNFRGKRVD